MLPRVGCERLSFFCFSKNTFSRYGICPGALTKGRVDAMTESALAVKETEECLVSTLLLRHLGLAARALTVKPRRRWRKWNGFKKLIQLSIHRFLVVGCLDGVRQRQDTRGHGGGVRLVVHGAARPRSTRRPSRGLFGRRECQVCGRLMPSIGHQRANGRTEGKLEFSKWDGNDWPGRSHHKRCMKYVE